MISHYNNHAHIIKHNKKMLIFLRHAERGDNQHPTQHSQIPYDPPITKQSNKTIKQTASQLSQIFKQNNITNFTITTSRFLRCLMTSQQLQKQLSCYGFTLADQRYTIDDRIGEYLREDWYERYPMDRLIYQSQFRGKYLQDRKYEEVKVEDKFRDFPENYVKFHFRVGNFKKYLRFPDEGTCTLVVTHGFVVRELCFTMNQLPRYQNQIKYCGYAAYKKTSDGQVLIRSKL